jgi:hypothetical protein
MLIRALGSLDQKGMHAVPTNYPVTVIGSDTQ